MVTLKYGSQGEDVKTLQTNLTNAGYDVGGVDGIYGTKTANAVKQYQQANGLAVDGIAGSNTLAKLSGGAASTPTTTAKAPAPDYTTQNMKVRDNLYAQIMGRKPFSYDAASDPVYQQYKDLYTQQGKMAMEDSMGQAAALTGGYGNTYGQAVGQQQYNDYMQKLNGIIPDLENSAYSRWQAEGSNLMNRYNMVEQQVQTEKADAQSQVSALISIGQMPDDRLIALSGYDKSYVARMVQYAKEQKAQAAASSRGSGGGGGGTPKGTYYNSSTGKIETIKNRQFSFDPDEGTFMWEGKTYSTVNGLVSAWNKTSLSDDDEKFLRSRFKSLTGKNLSDYGY